MWLALGFAATGLVGYRTWELYRDFTHPELRMFRDYVADPIPREVRGLTLTTGAPAMFHRGALIRFQAPEETLRRILDHSLPGSKTVPVVEDMKKQSGRDPRDQMPRI